MFKSIFGRKRGPEPLSDAERFLLSLFLKPRRRTSITAPGWSETWAGQLGRNPDTVLAKFEREGLLAKPDVTGLLGVAFRVPELERLCEAFGLSSKGTKETLITRLAAAVPEAELLRRIGAVDALVCTDIGRGIAEEFQAGADRLRVEAETAVVTALKARRIDEACRIVREFEAKNPIPRGIGIDWSRHDMSRERGMVQELLSGQAVPDDVALASAQAVLWGTKPEKFLPKRTEPRKRKTPEEKAAERKAQSAAIRAAQRATLRSFKANRDVIVGIQILAAGSSCDHCRSMAGKYTFDTVPQLPHAGCTHEMGCRCVYVPLTSLSEP